LENKGRRKRREDKEERERESVLLDEGLNCHFEKAWFWLQAKSKSVKMGTTTLGFI